METLDLITVVTYVCAILGGILLFICVLLALFILYLQCKNHLRERESSYVVVPRGDPTPINAENGTVGKKGEVKTGVFGADAR